MFSFDIFQSPQKCFILWTVKYDTFKNKAEWKVVKSNEDQIMVRADICQEEVE